MKDKLPKHFNKFVEKYSSIWQAHEQMTEACANAGPIDRKSRELIKLAICATAGMETPTERHAVMAIENGASKEEVYQTVLQLITTVGFPRASVALMWVQRAIEPNG